VNGEPANFFDPMTGPLGVWLEGLSLAIEIIAVVILVVGAVRFLTYAVTGLFHHGQGASQTLQTARLHLGVYILAALEFLIVADIIYTIVNRTLTDVITLAVVAAVRTVISWFLGREIEHIRQRDQGPAEGLTPELSKD
jgi:uncharacterized membrane protein